MANLAAITAIKEVLTKLADPITGRVQRLGYTQTAYDNQDIAGVATYNFNQEQNIPDTEHTETVDTIIDKGVRAQGASIGRMFQNHFTGRVSFNLNLVVDLFLTLCDTMARILAHNSNEYDPTATYYSGDMVFTINTYASVPVYMWYRLKQGQTVTGVAPPNTNYWEPMQEYTSLAKVLTNINTVDFNNLLGTELYSYVGNGSPLVMLHAPPMPPGDSGTFIFFTKGDINETDVTVQKLHYRDSGIEYTRTLHGTTVKQDWWVTDDPNYVATIIGVPNTWTFRVEADGHLYLYYDEANPPDVFVDRDTTSPTYGHLIWRYEGEPGVPVPPAVTGAIPATEYNRIMVSDPDSAPEAVNKSYFTLTLPAGYSANDAYVINFTAQLYNTNTPVAIYLSPIQFSLGILSSVGADNVYKSLAQDNSGVLELGLYGASVEDDTNKLKIIFYTYSAYNLSFNNTNAKIEVTGIDFYKNGTGAPPADAG